MLPWSKWHTEYEWGHLVGHDVCTQRRYHENSAGSVKLAELTCFEYTHRARPHSVVFLWRRQKKIGGFEWSISERSWRWRSNYWYLWLQTKPSCHKQRKCASVCSSIQEPWNVLYPKAKETSFGSWFEQTTKILLATKVLGIVVPQLTLFTEWNMVIAGNLHADCYKVIVQYA